MVKINFRKKIKNLNISKILGIPFFIITILFIAFPFLMIILYSFKKDPDASIFNMELTFNNYYRLWVLWGSLFILHLLQQLLLF